MITTKMAEMLTGEKVIAGTGRMVITDNTQHLPVEYKGYKKYMIGGAIITDADFPIDGHWHMIECDIIFIPKKLFREFRESDGLKIDQILVSGYEKEENWMEEILF